MCLRAKLTTKDEAKGLVGLDLDEDGGPEVAVLDHSGEAVAVARRMVARASAPVFARRPCGYPLACRRRLPFL